MLLNIHRLTICGSLSLSIEAGVCLGDKLNSLIVEPSERANRLGANVEKLLLGGRRKKG